MSKLTPTFLARKNFPVRIFSSTVAMILIAGCGDKPQKTHSSSSSPSTVKTIAAHKAKTPPPSPAATEVVVPSEPEEVPPTVADPIPVSLRESLVLALSEVDSVKRIQALEAVGWNSIETDPEIYREAFNSIPSGSPESRRLLTHSAIRMADSDPEAAIALAESIIGDHSLSEVAGAIAVALSESDPRRSASIVAKLTDPSVQARSAVQVLQRWSAKEPTAAVAWVSAFPAGPIRTDGLSVVLQSWLKSDAPGVASWLANSSSEKVRAESLTTISDLILQQPEGTRADTLAYFPEVKLPAQN